jgi:hypothetical protein
MQSACYTKRHAASERPTSCGNEGGSRRRFNAFTYLEGELLLPTLHRDLSRARHDFKRKQSYISGSLSIIGLQFARFIIGNGSRNFELVPDYSLKSRRFL